VVGVVIRTRSHVNRRVAAEAEYKNSWRALFTVATGLEVPALHAAVRRFRAAAIVLSATPRTTGRTVLRDLTIEEVPTLCLSCGDAIPQRGPRDRGPQPLYCSRRCKARETMRRYRDKRRASAAEQVSA
jgi:hypothetical protein